MQHCLNCIAEIFTACSVSILLICFVRALRALPAGPKIALRFPRLFVCLFVCMFVCASALALITCAVLHHALLRNCSLLLYCANRFWRLVGQDTTTEYRFLLPRRRKSGRQAYCFRNLQLLTGSTRRNF